MKQKPDYMKLAISLALTSAASIPLAAQTAPATPAAPAPAEGAAVEEDVVVLSPFEVTASETTGYAAADTLAGNRLNTELRDIGNAVTVVTGQFLKDVGATSSETLLQYTTSTEVGNIHGNFTGVGDGGLLNETGRFTNPNQNTRVRGLTAADYTRDFFKSDSPWDGYNVDRVDFQRGPNSILFGQGSPGGIINTATKQARFKDGGEAEVRLGQYGTYRGSLDYNKVLIDRELAVRIVGLEEREEFKQRPAFEKDRRIYGAVRWEPEFMRKGSARTIVKANFEAGQIRSNRPRTLPPIDMITPWFYTGTFVSSGNGKTYNNLNKGTYNPFQVQDDNSARPNHGQNRPKINGGPLQGTDNPYFQPWMGNFAQSFGGPVAYYASDTTNPPTYWIQERPQRWGINSNGQADPNGGIVAYHRPVGVATMPQFANNAGLKYAALYKNRNLTDASIFDFYNNLIDGPNKKEWQDFRNFNINLAQTFFNDKAGFEAVYDNQLYKNGQLSLLTDSRQAIYIDMMAVYADGTPQGLNGEPFADGTKNPNVGRAFISDSGQGGNNSYKALRESKRATAFIQHDFNDTWKNWLGKLLGKNTLTGLLSEDTTETDNRSWQRYAVLDQNYVNLINPASGNKKFTDNWWAVNHVIYLGPSLASASSASGANLPRPSVEHVATSGTIRMFDSHWNKPTNPADPNYVNPGDVWYNPYYTPTWPSDGSTNNNYTSTQSDNPANYVGYRDVSFQITDSEAAEGNRDLLSTFAQKRKVQVSSNGLVLQSAMWDKLVVATAGIRTDTVRTKTVKLDTNSSSSDPVTGRLNLSESNYALPQDWESKITKTSKSYGAVVHLDPILDKFLPNLPVKVSAYYAHSTNFQPEANRVDIYGEQIPLPGGTTIERGVLLETKDGKYSLKVNKFKTAVTNANSSGLSGAWFIGASQTWSGNWANRFEFNWTGDTIDTAVANPDPNNSMYNYAPAPKADGTIETLAEAQAREAAAIAAYRAWQASVDPRFYAAWKINLNDKTKSLTSSNPPGFSITEDSVSTGYEFELNTQITKNWRLTFNATKATAVRTNIGGKNLADFMNAYGNAMRNTAAGDLRIWWGGAGNETALFQWNKEVGGEWALRSLQDGTNVPELRKWRWNLITNYDFTEGRLRGFSVGGGARWQDSVVIGYMPAGTNAAPSYDLSQPTYGPSELNFDVWVGYGRKIWRDIDWRVQLNVANVGEGNKLIPITINPDGTVAGYRISPPQRITLANTFKF